jgi:hypothetical protein
MIIDDTLLSSFHFSLYIGCGRVATGQSVDPLSLKVKISLSLVSLSILMP